MADERKVRIGVLEDEPSIGRVWLFWLRQRASGWAEPEDEPFVKVADALEWVNRQEDDAWLLVVDVDLDEEELREELEKARRQLKDQDSILGGKAGLILVSYLQRLGLLGHVLIITGVAYGPLLTWLRDQDVAFQLKPVRALTVTDALRERWRQVKETRAPRDGN